MICRKVKTVSLKSLTSEPAAHLSRCLPVPRSACPPLLSTSNSQPPSTIYPSPTIYVAIETYPLLERKLLRILPRYSNLLEPPLPLSDASVGWADVGQHLCVRTYSYQSFLLGCYCLFTYLVYACLFWFIVFYVLAPELRTCRAVCPRRREARVKSDQPARFEDTEIVDLLGSITCLTLVV